MFSRLVFRLRSGSSATVNRSRGTYIISRTVGRRFLSGGEIIALASTNALAGATISLLGICGLYYFLSGKGSSVVFDSDGPLDLTLIRNEIRSLCYDVRYEDGCLAPLLLRLAFNQCATYSKYDGLGGSNGASIRFEPEQSMKHNKGMEEAMSALATLQQQYSKISLSDLWVLASYVAIEEMGGPFIDFVPGRRDCDSSACLESERFPEWDQGATRLLDWFDRMSLTDREGVSLLGAHSCGRLHALNCGIDGSWTSSPGMLSSAYFKQIKFIPYVFERRGDEHYFDPSNPELCLLPIEGAFFYSARVMRWAEFYAYADEHTWLQDFAFAWKKITELGL